MRARSLKVTGMSLLDRAYDFLLVFHSVAWWCNRYRTFH